MAKTKFEPEDFVVEWEAPDGVRITDKRISIEIANQANARLEEIKKAWLEELLKDAPLVYGSDETGLWGQMVP